MDRHLAETTTKAENRALTSIRAVAALWVVGYHLGAAFHDTPPIVSRVFDLGFAGVDLFFVLSGFILMKVHPTLTASDWQAFMLRRVFRVYPLHVFVMGTLLVAVLIARRAHIDLDANGNYALEGFVPAALLLKWLTPPGAAWNAPSWSVAAEMVCYAALPFLALRLRMATRRALSLLVGALAFLACAWLGSVIAYYEPNLGDGMLRWPGVVRGGLDFFLGAALATLASADRDPFRNKGTALELAGGGFFVAICMFGQAMLVPAASAILIAGLSLNTGPLSKLLVARPLHWLGRISFSVYLLHSPIISALAKLSWTRLPPWAVAPARDTVILALALAAATLTNRYIEEPCRRIPGRITAYRLARSRPYLI